jgi:hypothetical protein
VWNDVTSSMIISSHDNVSIGLLVLGNLILRCSCIVQETSTAPKVNSPLRVDLLDVVGRLTPSMNGNQEFTQHPNLNAQTCEIAQSLEPTPTPALLPVSSNNTSYIYCLDNINSILHCIAHSSSHFTSTLHSSSPTQLTTF